MAGAHSGAGERPTNVSISAGDDGDRVDPRRLRSRAKLLDAATALLASGGVEAVTIDAVTRASKVARATLYRHFDSSAHLLAATFERLLPPQMAPTTPDASLRDRLVELLTRQAKVIDETPVHVTTLAWLALGGPDPDATYGRHQLRSRVIDEYRKPFDEVLESDEARRILGDFDMSLVQCQLVGPIVFARLTGLRQLDAADCERIVDDFLAARTHASEVGRS